MDQSMPAMISIATKLAIVVALALLFLRRSQAQQKYRQAFNLDNNCTLLQPAHQLPRCAFNLNKERNCFRLNGLHSNVSCEVNIDRISQSNCGIRLSFFDINLLGSNEEGYCTTEFVSIVSCVPEADSRLCGRISQLTREYPFQLDATHFPLEVHLHEAQSQIRFTYELLDDCDAKRPLFWNPPISSFSGNNETIPCYVAIAERHGTINSPWFPDPYPPSMDCVYEFKRNGSHIPGIKMTTNAFNLESDWNTPMGGACSDFLQLPGCGFICGIKSFTWTAWFQPGASSILLHFHSDEQWETQGFQIEFQQLIINTTLP